VAQDAASVGVHDRSCCGSQRLQSRPTDDIHRRVELVEIPDPQPVSYTVGADPSLDQLRAVNQTSLGLSDPGNLPVATPPNPF
jgi:hypothetical protein